ncbi:MAG: DUF5050 domain-containing protein, partial [bacterium]
SNALTATKHIITQISNTGGIAGDNIQSLTVCGNALFFTAVSSISGTTLFKYDGSNITRLEVNQASGIVALNDKLYVVALNGPHLKLFSYNTLDNSMVQVSDIFSGDSDAITQLTAYDGQVFFSAAPGVTPSITKLYKYNPVDKKTTQVSNINNGSSDSPTYLTVYNGSLYFRAIKTGTFDKIYKYKSDSSAVTQVSNLSGAGGDGIYAIKVFNGDLYLTAGGKLFKYNPSLYEGKMVRVSNINGVAGTPSGADTPTYLTELNGELYFSANKTTSPVGLTKLYKYNPTDDKITQISNIHDDGADAPTQLTAFNGELYFSAFDGTTVAKLYRYNPRDNKITKVISDKPDTFANLTVFDGALYFSATSAYVTLDPEHPEAITSATRLYKFE